MPGAGKDVTVRGNVSITGGYQGAVYVVDGEVAAVSLWFKRSKWCCGYNN